MSFSTLSVAVADLRNSLGSFVSPDALTEVNLRPPVDGDGEISFLRLVAWSYVLIFEAGRISIPFLLRASSTYEMERPSIEVVHAMRTWSFHNLGFTSDRDLEISRLVHRWFLEVCGEPLPDTQAQWNTCFDHLCAIVHKIVRQCQNAVTGILLSPDDGDLVISDMRHRLERVWAANRFDELVGEIAIGLGIRIDVVKFRTPRLATWRKFLQSIPDDDDPMDAMARLIERDLLEYEESILPISGRDVMSLLDIGPGTMVGKMLRYGRDLFNAGIRERGLLLEHIAKHAKEVHEGGVNLD